jgi:hypothetical protein
MDVGCEVESDHDLPAGLTVHSQLSARHPAEGHTSNPRV